MYCKKTKYKVARKGNIARFKLRNAEAKIQEGKLKYLTRILAEDRKCNTKIRTCIEISNDDFQNVSQI